eukprot:1155473-Pelagomonas_calceolata.AAC.2
MRHKSVITPEAVVKESWRTCPIQNGHHGAHGRLQATPPLCTMPHLTHARDLCMQDGVTRAQEVVMSTQVLV